jgi:hypothetical protein
MGKSYQNMAIKFDTKIFKKSSLPNEKEAYNEKGPYLKTNYTSKE